MGFFDDLAKDVALWGAVQASKDAKGKPDPYKAAGIAAGMGKFSSDDSVMLGAMLGSQRAFDNDYYDDDSWKLFCEDGLEYGIDPEDYETEEEYNEAIELAKSELEEVPDTISVPITLKITTPKHDTSQESVSSSAVKREQYMWRKRYRRQETYGINVCEYETEGEFLQALAIAREEFLETAQNDKEIYYYCAVVYEDNPYPYHYRTNDTTLKIGDKVIVPVGHQNAEKIAKIVSVEQHSRLSVPYPVEKTKFIIRKCEE